MIESDRRIEVYPSRARLLRYVLLYAVAAVPMAGLSVAWIVDDVHSGWGINLLFLPVLISGPVGALILLSLTTFTFYRVLVRKPSVVITDEGIVDGCSLIAGGLGLMRWHEMRAIFVLHYGKGHAFLAILPSDPRAVRGRRDPFARLFLRSITLNLAIGVGLPQWMLAVPAERLLEQVHDHYGAILIANDVVVPSSPPRS